MLRELLARFTRTLPMGVETRSYTLAVSEYLEKNAASNPASDATVFKEICAGMWGRAFASATVTPDNPQTRALTSSVLESMGRALVDPGECVFQIDVDASGVTLRPAASFKISGALEWTYRVKLAGPSLSVKRTLPAASVLHPRYGATASEPWKGVGPLSASRMSVILSNVLEQRLGQEAKARVGFLLPVPQLKTELQADIDALEGKTVLAETTSGSWKADSPSAAPKSDYDVKRLGAMFTPNHAPMRDAVGRSILAACGVPSSVLGDTDGAYARESFRQFLHSTIQPVADIIAGELAVKLDTPGLAFSFERLFAGDLTGRARAFQSMVGGGMDVEKAASLAGLMVSE